MTPTADSLSPTFSHFLISLASETLAQLGEGERGQAPDLAAAAHTLQLVQILADKTRGNLDEEESRLMEAVLRELSERYKAKAAAR